MLLVLTISWRSQVAISVKLEDNYNNYSLPRSGDGFLKVISIMVCCLSLVDFQTQPVNLIETTPVFDITGLDGRRICSLWLPSTYSNFRRWRLSWLSIPQKWTEEARLRPVEMSAEQSWEHPTPSIWFVNWPFVWERNMFELILLRGLEYFIEWQKTVP
jgi:hypothetical protein